MKTKNKYHFITASLEHNLIWAAIDRKIIKTIGSLNPMCQHKFTNMYFEFSTVLGRHAKHRSRYKKARLMEMVRFITREIKDGYRLFTLFFYLYMLLVLYGFSCLLTSCKFINLHIKLKMI